MKEKIVKTFLTEALTLKEIGDKFDLTAERIRQLLNQELTYFEYKKRKAEITQIRKANRVVNQKKEFICEYCNTPFTKLYVYKIKPRFCSPKHFYEFKKNLLTPEERDLKNKEYRKKYYANYWKKKKKQ